MNAYRETVVLIKILKVCFILKVEIVSDERMELGSYPKPD